MDIGLGSIQRFMPYSLCSYFLSVLCSLYLFSLHSNFSPQVFRKEMPNNFASDLTLLLSYWNNILLCTYSFLHVVLWWLYYFKYINFNQKYLHYFILNLNYLKKNNYNYIKEYRHKKVIWIYEILFDFKSPQNKQKTYICYFPWIISNVKDCFPVLDGYSQGPLRNHQIHWFCSRRELF